MNERIKEFMQTKSGFFFDTGESVLFILDSVDTIVKNMAICGGYKVSAIKIQKTTGEEDRVVISKRGNPFALDMDMLMQFLPFGKGNSDESLGQQLKILFNKKSMHSGNTGKGP